MADLLAPAHQALAAQARQLAAAVAQLAASADEASDPDPAMVEALRASGLTALVVPAAYGGRDARVDAVSVTVVREAFMGVSTHLDALFAMQGIGSFPLTLGGDEQLRQEWLPKVATLDTLAALALTEDEAGSDLKAVRTTITVESGELVVTGEKSFISNAGAAGFYCVLGREGDGYSLVLVPAGALGLTARPGPVLTAPHLLGSLQLDRVKVPAHHRLGPPGGGFGLALATLGTFRVSVAGAAVGLAQAVLDEAVRHANARQQFGRPLAGIGPVGQLLARSWTEIEMARVFTYHAAAKAAEDPRGQLDISTMAKLAATELAGQVVDRCGQVMGRYGLVRGSVVERAYRAVRPMRIYEGASEVLLDSLARRLAKRGAGTT